MRRIYLLLFVFLNVLFLGGCKVSGGNGFSGDTPPIYYSVNGTTAAIDGDYLVVGDFNSLKVINLRTRKTVKNIPGVPKRSPVTFDIFGDTVVWSDIRNDKRGDKGNEIGDVEKLNSDIFSLNIRTGELRQITKDPAAQIYPKIWQNYVVWQDNRNDTVKDYPGEWDIYMYDLNTRKEKQITFAPGSHTNPEISDNKIVWEDGRNFKGDISLRAGDNVPENNTDIYLYDINKGRELSVSTGKYKESNPSVYGNFVVWEDRNKGKFEADIMFYDYSTGKTREITDDRFNQSTPKVYKNYIVWMDERRGISSNDVYVNGKPPNSDIFLYDLKTETEKRLTGDEVQLDPHVSDRWVVNTLSRQAAPEIQVIQYR